MLELNKGKEEDQDLARRIWVWETKYKIKSRDLWNHYMTTGKTHPKVPSEVANDWRECWDVYCHRMALDHRRDEIDFSQPLREFTTIEKKTLRSYEQKYGLCSVDLYNMAKSMTPKEWADFSLLIAGIDVWLAAWRYWCRLNGLDPSTAAKKEPDKV